MPQSIPSGLARDHVLRALADLDAKVEHPFGQPTGYELVHEGKRYAPKAVIGLAFRYSIGRVLLPEEFSGGEAPGQAHYILRRLGFSVIKKGEEAEVPEQEQTGKDWSENEVQIVVADYFDMLRAEIEGGEYPISTGPLEGTNNKIKTMNRQRYGLRDGDFFTLKLYQLHEAKYALVG